LSDELDVVDLDYRLQGERRRSAHGSSIYSEEIQDVPEGDPGEEGKHEYCTSSDELAFDTATTHLTEQASQEERRDAATIEWRDRQQIQHREIR
jgi:hypothetical protein